MVVVGPTHNLSRVLFDMGPSVLISAVLKLIHGMQEFELKRQWSYYLASCSYRT